MALTLSGTNGVVGAGFTVDASGVSVTAGVGTFSSVQGSGANLTSLPAAQLTGALPAISAASLTSIPAANLVGVCTSGLTKTGGFGKILQIVQFATSSTNNYASVDFQNTVVTVNITPTESSSKFLIRSSICYGLGAQDCAVSFNWSDSLHASGTTHPIAPMSGDGTNGAEGSRLPAYWGTGCFDDSAPVDNYFVGSASAEYLYTPASASSSQRAFTVMVRSSFGRNVRFNMNAHYNAANPRDIRPSSSITVMEVSA